MLLGTPTLSLVGAVGAALTLGARRGGVLIPLLVLPLYVPALIFRVGATDAALFGLAARPHLLLLGAELLVMLVVTPLAGAAALRQALEWASECFPPALGAAGWASLVAHWWPIGRSEEHTSELQSLM